MLTWWSLYKTPSARRLGELSGECIHVPGGGAPHLLETGPPSLRTPSGTHSIYILLWLFTSILFYIISNKAGNAANVSVSSVSHYSKLYSLRQGLRADAVVGDKVWGKFSHFPLPSAQQSDPVEPHMPRNSKSAGKHWIRRSLSLNLFLFLLFFIWGPAGLAVLESSFADTWALWWCAWASLVTENRLYST